MEQLQVKSLQKAAVISNHVRCLFVLMHHASYRFIQAFLMYLQLLLQPNPESLFISLNASAFWCLVVVPSTSQCSTKVHRSRYQYYRIFHTVAKF